VTESPPAACTARASPLTAGCPLCEALPGERCLTASGRPARPHRPRGRLALAVLAHADPVLDGHFTRTGQCGMCGVPGLDARHRVVDAMASRMAAGEPAPEVAEDYGASGEAAAAVQAWAARWPGAWR